METTKLKSVSNKDKTQIEKYISSYTELTIKSRENPDFPHECYIDVLNIRDLLENLSGFTGYNLSEIMSEFKIMLEIANEHNPSLTEHFLTVYGLFSNLTISLAMNKELMNRKYMEYKKLAQIMEPYIDDIEVR